MNLKYRVTSLLLLATASAGYCQSTVDSTSRYTHGANIGWMDWRAGDGSAGAVVNRQFAGGSIYAANIGWISLGDGTPADGTAYGNDSAVDSGVNLGPGPNSSELYLSGFGYSANVGWISFNNADPATRPRVEKSTGTLRGYAWGANVGWIPLEQAGQVVITNPALLADPTTPTPTATPTGTATPTVTPSPTPALGIVQVLLGLIDAAPAFDYNEDARIDAADVTLAP